MKILSQVLGTKETLQKNNIHRFIWEFLLNIDYQLKLQNVTNQLTIQLDKDPRSKGQSTSYRQSYEPMLELTNIYHNNPILLKYLDGFTSDNLTKILCHEVITGNQLAVAV